jgi:hypothetical protein
MKNLKTTLLLAVILPACSTVQPLENAESVTVVNAEHVTTCKLLATISSRVTHKVGLINRSEETVTAELITLGRNRAVELGGDSLVIKQPMSEGQMKFDIYKCRL